MVQPVEALLDHGWSRVDYVSAIDEHNSFVFCRGAEETEHGHLARSQGPHEIVAARYH